MENKSNAQVYFYANKEIEIKNIKDFEIINDTIFDKIYQINEKLFEN